jgi:hypothetical protein
MEESKHVLTLEQKFRVEDYKRSISNLSREELQFMCVKGYESIIKLENHKKKSSPQK